MIKIKLNQTEYKRILIALRKVRYKSEWWFTFNGGELNRRCAIEYVQLVIGNIGRLTRPTPPYNVRYRSWKFEYGRMGYPAPWRLFGDLIRNITNFRVGRGWMGGIPKDVYDVGGKSWFGKGDKGKPKKIAMYARKAEARRPIFEPTMDQYASAGWGENIQKAFIDIERAWS